MGIADHMNYRLIQMEKGKELQRQLKGKTKCFYPTFV